MKKSLIIIFLAVSIFAVVLIKNNKHNITQSNVVKSLPKSFTHIYSPDGRFIDPSILKTIGDGSISYAIDTPGKWSVLISEKPSNTQGEKLYTIPTSTEIIEWKKMGTDITKVNIKGSDAYVWQGQKLPTPQKTIIIVSSLDMTMGDIDITILSLKPLDTDTLIKIAQSLSLCELPQS